MTNEELLQKYRQTFDFLSRKGIMELRAYGRAFGVRTPTAKHKRELIEEIIKIAAGFAPKPPATNKGARVRAKPVTDEEIEQLQGMLRSEGGELQGMLRSEGGELQGMFRSEGGELQGMFREKDESAQQSASQEIFLNGRHGTYILRGKLTVHENGAFNLSLEGDIQQS